MSGYSFEQEKKILEKELSKNEQEYKRLQKVSKDLVSRKEYIDNMTDKEEQEKLKRSDEYLTIDFNIHETAEKRNKLYDEVESNRKKLKVLEEYIKEDKKNVENIKKIEKLEEGIEKKQKAQHDKNIATISKETLKKEQKRAKDILKLSKSGELKLPKLKLDTKRKGEKTAFQKWKGEFPKVEGKEIGKYKPVKENVSVYEIEREGGWKDTIIKTPTEEISIVTGMPQKDKLLSLIASLNEEDKENVIRKIFGTFDYVTDPEEEKGFRSIPRTFGYHYGDRLNKWGTVSKKKKSYWDEIRSSIIKSGMHLGIKGYIDPEQLFPMGRFELDPSYEQLFTAPDYFSAENAGSKDGRNMSYIERAGGKDLIPDVFKEEASKEFALFETGSFDKRYGVNEKSAEEAATWAANRLVRLIDFSKRIDNIFEEVAGRLDSGFSSEELTRAYLAKESPETLIRYLRSKKLREEAPKYSSGEELMNWLIGQLSSFGMLEESDLMKQIDVAKEFGGEKKLISEFSERAKFLFAPSSRGVSPTTVEQLAKGTYKFGKPMDEADLEVLKEGTLLTENLGKLAMTDESIEKQIENREEIEEAIANSMDRYSFYVEQLANPEIQKQLQISSKQADRFINYLKQVNSFAKKIGLDLQTVLEGLDIESISDEVLIREEEAGGQFEKSAGKLFEATASISAEDFSKALKLPTRKGATLSPEAVKRIFDSLITESISDSSSETILDKYLNFPISEAEKIISKQEQEIKEERAKFETAIKAIPDLLVKISEENPNIYSIAQDNQEISEQVTEKAVEKTTEVVENTMENISENVEKEAEKIATETSALTADGKKKFDKDGKKLAYEYVDTEGNLLGSAFAPIQKRKPRSTSTKTKKEDTLNSILEEVSGIHSDTSSIKSDISSISSKDHSSRSKKSKTETDKTEMEMIKETLDLRKQEFDVLVDIEKIKGDPSKSKELNILEERKKSLEERIRNSLSWMTEDLQKSYSKIERDYIEDETYKIALATAKAEEKAGEAQKAESEKKISSAISLLYEELKLREKIVSLKNDKDKKADVEAYKREADRLKLERSNIDLSDEEREIYREQAKELSASEQYKFDIAEEEARRKNIKNVQKEYKNYENLVKEAARYEIKIDELNLRYQTALTEKEKDSIAHLRSIEQINLSRVQSEIDLVEQKGILGNQDLVHLKNLRAILVEEGKAKNLVAQKGQQTFWDVLARDIQTSILALGNFNIAHRVIRQIPQDIRKVINITKQLDQVITNVQIVTGKSRSEAEKYLDTYIELGKQLGVTSTQVASATVEWLRQGYSVQESQKLVTASIQLSKLGMMDAGAATSSLTAVLKGFRLEASEASAVVDKLVSLDLDYATSAGEIATALSKVSAVARNANMNLDETSSILTVLMDITQAEAGSVGTALQTILSRFGNVKAGAFVEMEESGEDTATAINDVEKVLTPLGIKIRSSEGDIRNFNDVMEELSQRWITLDDVTRNAISTAFAGTRQRNYFNTLVTSWGEVQEAQEIAMNSEGMSSKKYEAYTESVASSIERITLAWEEFTKKLQASGAIKAFSQTLSFIVEQLDNILAFASSRTAMSLINNVSFKSIAKGTGKSAFGFLTGTQMSSKENKTENNISKIDTNVKEILDYVSGRKTKVEESKDQTEYEITKTGKTSGRWKYALASGLGAGVSRLLTTEEEYGGEKLTAGLTSGIINGIGAAFGPAGIAISSIVDMFFTPLMTKGIQKIIHGQEIAREERSKEAQAQLDALTKLTSSLEDGIESINLKNEEMTSADWKNWDKIIDGLKSGLSPFEDEEGEKDYQKNAEYRLKLEKELNNILGRTEDSYLTLDHALSQLAKRTGDYDSVFTAFSAAQNKLAVESEYAASEVERYTLKQKIREAEEDKLKASSVDEIEELNKYIKSLRFEIEQIEEQAEQGRIKTAFISSGISGLTTIDIASSTLNGVLTTWAKEYEEQGGVAFNSLGELSDSFRTYATSLIQQDDKLSALLNNNAVRLGLMEDKITEYFKGMIVGESDSDWSVFTKGLMMSKEELKSSSQYWWVTTKDMTSGISGLTNKFKDLNDIISDLATNGKLSSESLEKLSSQYTELFIRGKGKDATFSSDNIIKNITEIITGGSGADVYKRVAASSVAYDVGILDAYKQFAMTKGRSAYGDETYNAIMAASSIYELYGKLDEDKIREIGEVADSLIPDLNIASALQDTLIQKQIKQYESEIENLNSLKEALDSSEKAREKEVDLIKARQKLENIQNQKNRVYRTGIGWTYVSDQEAISDAREELDRLEREQQQENIEYQIDLLEQQKDILESIDENKKLDTLNSTAKKILLAMGMDENGNISTAYLSKLESVAPGVAEMLTGGGAESYVIQSLQGKIDQLRTDAAAINKGLSGYSAKEIESYNAKIDKFTTESAELFGDTNYQKYKSELSGIEDITSVSAKKITDIFDENTYDFMKLAGGGTSSGEDDHVITSYDINKKPNGFIRYRIGNNGNLIVDNSDVLPKGDLVKDDHGIPSYVSYNMKNLPDGFYENPKYPGQIFYVENGKVSYGGGYTGEFRDLNWWNGKINEARRSYYGYSRGTFSAVGGPSLINENGLEGIITPNGTVTSLPRGTGILPSDLTRNLYNLGEVAPNLIKKLIADGNLEKSKINSVEDKSTHINTLHAEFNVDEGFDFDKFLIDVKQVVDTTKNNK